MARPGRTASSTTFPPCFRAAVHSLRTIAAVGRRSRSLQCGSGSGSGVAGEVAAKSMRSASRLVASGAPSEAVVAVRREQADRRALGVPRRPAPRRRRSSGRIPIGAIRHDRGVVSRATRSRRPASSWRLGCEAAGDRRVTPACTSASSGHPARCAGASPLRAGTSSTPWHHWRYAAVGPLRTPLPLQRLRRQASLRVARGVGEGASAEARARGGMRGEDRPSTSRSMRHGRPLVVRPASGPFQLAQGGQNDACAKAVTVTDVRAVLPRGWCFGNLALPTRGGPMPT